ncbi:MAG: molybdopterin molybdotransferase MoeA [Desulfobacterales bacterium]
MKEFFNVTDLNKVLEYASAFPRVEIETIPLFESLGRILVKDIHADVDLPDFMRSTMDGYAVCASSTFGASEANPAYLIVKGTVPMGASPDFTINPGEAARISTGGMLPKGADSVVMIEHTEAIDKTSIEVYRGVAPAQNILEKGEDFHKDAVLIPGGKQIRAQEIGLLAAFGVERINVYKKPVIGIISSGDEVVSIKDTPAPGQIRDINMYTLAGLVQKSGAIPINYGIVRDDFNDLFEKCTAALIQSDMVLISGGSSVGARDYTIEVLSALFESEILVHGISISPGKPTILAKAQNQAIWGLPGQVTSTMVVFEIVVKPFIEHIRGLLPEHKRQFNLFARLGRNVSSTQGRADYIRIKLFQKDGTLWAEPILGKSGLINTMVKADGLIEIGLNTEGLDRGDRVEVIPL